MLAVTAPVTVAPVSSYTVVKKTTTSEQESTFSDSVDVSASQPSENPYAFDPNAVSVSPATLMTALSFQEKFGNSDSDTDEEGDDSNTETGSEDGEEAAELSDEEKTAAAEAEKEADPSQLSDEEIAEVQTLTLQDLKVRNNEEAHVRVGGQYTSQPKYEFQTGPDNRKYAVSGHVEIDAAAIAGKPEDTIRKLRIVKRAALAPAEPSAEDLKVAAVASNGIQQAVGAIRERVAEDIRTQRAKSSQEADEAAIELSRIKKSVERNLVEESTPTPNQTITPSKTNKPDSQSVSVSNPAEANIAAQALERAAALTPQAPSSDAYASAVNASVISNNDVSFATVIAAPGLFFDTAI